MSISGTVIGFVNGFLVKIDIIRSFKSTFITGMHQLLCEECIEQK